jgi:hypothetical protein
LCSVSFQKLWEEELKNLSEYLVSEFIDVKIDATYLPFSNLNLTFGKTEAFKSVYRPLNDTNYYSSEITRKFRPLYKFI